MSEYFYSPYRLKLAGAGRLNAQTEGDELKGALLRHRDGGFACLQPWPTLGQGDLADSLALLRDGGESDLLSSCKRCLALDGAARAADLDLFEGEIVPPSHLSVPDWADFGWLEKKYSAGFEIFKLKCGADIRAEVQRIAELCARFGDGLSLRLDFNECLDFEAFREFVGLLGRSVEQIDFVEDPVVYNRELWRELSNEVPFDLAVDRAGGLASEGFSVRVFKPAWEPVIECDRRAVITSAMDHPLGQLFAAYEAVNYDGLLDDCGLLTHWLFEPNEFSEVLGVEDRKLVPPGGSGLGFDDLLEALHWRAL